MVYQSQQILMPGAMDLGGGGLSKSGKTRDDGFSKVLDSKIRPVYRPDIRNKSESAKTKPLKESSNNNPGSERQPSKIIADDNYDKSTEAIKPGEDAKLAKKADSGKDEACRMPGTAYSEEDVSHADDLKQAEELQCALDEIIDLLKKLVFFAEARVSVEDNSSRETESLPMETVNTQSTAKLDALRSELEKMLYAADRLEGTKTSEIAVKFAGQLLELLDDAGFARMLEEISIRTDTGQHQQLAALLKKMLNEAERAKMDVTRESIGEIIIPSMNSKTVRANQVEPGPDQQQADTSDEPKAETPSAKEINAPVDSASKQAEKTPGDRKSESDETFVFTKPKEQRTPVSDFTIQPDTTSFADAVESGDIPVTDGIKETVDVGTFVVRQVVEKAETLTSENKKEVVMQLKPDSLGKITLRVIHERGEIVARFVAENDQVKSILESNMQMLRDSLQRNGVFVQSLSVSVGQQNTGRNTGEDGEWNSEPGIRKHTASTSAVTGTAHETYGLSGLTGSLFESGEPVINLTA